MNPYLQTERTTTTFNDHLASKNAFTNTWSQSAYIKFMFKDIEADKLPYEVGLCMDGQELLNVGLGFYHHPESTYTLDPGTGTDSLQLHRTLVFGMVVFYNRRIGKKGYLLNAYLLYQNMGYGPKYLRNIGVFNTSTLIGNEDQLGDAYADRSAMGAGNVQPTLGTGEIVYSQFGLKFPSFKNGSAFMPYVTGTYKTFEAIEAPSVQYDIGLNYFINKHNAKITLQYSTRPVYRFDLSKPTGVAQNGLRGQFTLQTHLLL